MRISSKQMKIVRNPAQANNQRISIDENFEFGLVNKIC